MLRILVERARAHRRLKRGGDGSHKPNRVELGDHMLSTEPHPTELLAIDEILKRLEEYDAHKCEVVMLRYFAGLTIEEVAAAMNLTPAVVKGEWAYARAWLHREM